MAPDALKQLEILCLTADRKLSYGMLSYEARIRGVNLSLLTNTYVKSLTDGQRQSAEVVRTYAHTLLAPTLTDKVMAEDRYTQVKERVLERNTAPYRAPPSPVQAYTPIRTAAVAPTRLERIAESAKGFFKGLFGRRPQYA